MRRWTTRILICLVLGAVTTVAVAWGCAVRFDRRSTWDQWTMVPLNVEHEGVGYFEHLAILKLGAKISIHVTQGRGLSPSVRAQFADEYFRTGMPAWAARSAIQEFQSSSTIGNAHAIYIEAMGWPRPTMWRGWRGAATGLTMNLYAGIPTKWTVSKAPFLTDRRIVLPVRFVWPAFVLETIVLSALWFGIILGPGAARRAIRRKRGRCVKCAYDLRGDLDAGCPECGWGREEAES